MRLNFRGEARISRTHRTFKLLAGFNGAPTARVITTPEMASSLPRQVHLLPKSGQVANKTQIDAKEAAPANFREFSAA
jgi:hypothetical protein